MLSYGTNKEKKKMETTCEKRKEKKTDFKQFIIAAKVRNWVHVHEKHLA